ncbi:MAG TPA: ABC transporter permease [Bryobacteraceae bacterium]|nr:ABC transporter permease [Bryobacteraceae bacterium]
MRLVDDLSQDVRYGLRGLRRNPGFAGVAVLTIALGIGAATAIFSVTDAVLLKPLPYRDPQRLVLVEASNRRQRIENEPIRYELFERLRHETRESFEDMAALFVPRSIVPREDGSPELIYRGFCTTNFLEMMGARMLLGREFTPDDGQPQRFDPRYGVPPGSMAILTYEYWRSRYAGNPSVIGQEMRMYGARGPRIVGVLAPGFRLFFSGSGGEMSDPQVWIAYNLEYPPDSPAFFAVSVAGRLKNGVSLERAEQQLNRLASDGEEFRAEPILRKLVAQVRPAILSLFGAVMFLLLIACSNLANLLLARASQRERELAIRTALGGGWSRLMRQMLTESVLVALAGAVLGIAFAWAGLRELLAIAPANLPRIESAGIDWRVLAFAAAAALISAMIFGTMPALRAARPDVIRVFRGGDADGSGRWLRNGVVIAEVALSFVLLIGSGLMVRSFIELHRIDPGFDARGVLTMMILRDWDWSQPQAEREALLMAIQDRLRKIPGVENASAALSLPLSRVGPAFLGPRWSTESASGRADDQMVLPGYFETIGTRLIAGRVFNEADNAPGRRLVVIDEVLAAKAFPGQTAVGKRLTLFGRVFEVIGVVAHQRQSSLAEPGAEQFYRMDADGVGVSRQWAIRTSGDPMRLVPAVREALKEVDPLLLPREIQPMSAIVERAQSGTRFALLLISVFAGVAAMLAAIGLYGVLAGMVRRRTAEIGIRMALGAEPRSIFARVAGDGLKLAATGVAVGIFAAAGLTRIMASLLVGVKATDPWTFGIAAAAFLLLAAIACWIPARRAACVDPMAALRQE